MDVTVFRFADNGNTSLSSFYIDGKFMAFGIEDEKRAVKVKGETRIPSGKFDLVLRAEGGFHNRYKKLFPQMHKGMLCITNAPDYKIIADGMQFQYVLIHIGNTEKNTAACYLPNTSLDSSKFIGYESSKAYKLIYPIITDHLVSGGKVSINFVDLQ
tara:strand:+ start:93 stop:563 length:471 start_codon:yes stop_codon:yes gene_type:complete